MNSAEETATRTEFGPEELRALRQAPRRDATHVRVEHRRPLAPYSEPSFPCGHVFAPDLFLQAYWVSDGEICPVCLIDEVRDHKATIINPAVLQELTFSHCEDAACSCQHRWPLER